MEFQTQPLIFGIEGLDLRTALDKISPNNLARFTNAILTEDGCISSRPGIVEYLSVYNADALLASRITIDEFNSLDLYPVSGFTSQDMMRFVTVGFDVQLGYNVHSISRLNNPRLNDFDYIVGIGSALYCGQSVLNPISYNFSGNPLSLLAYRPPLSADSYMYVGDSLKMVKVAPDCTVSAIGLAKAVEVTERFQIDEFDTIAPEAGFTMRDLTRLSCVGFDIAEGGTGSFLTYAEAKTIEVDLFESMSWTNNAGTGGTPSNGLDNNSKEGTYAGKFISAIGGASAGYYNYWIRKFQIPIEGAGTVPVTADLPAIAQGTYTAWALNGGADKVSAVATQDFNTTVAPASAADAQSFTVQPPPDVATTTPLTSVIIIAYFGHPDYDVGDPMTGNETNLRVRLGGANQDSANFVPLAWIESAYDITALRPGGGTWTVADLSTVEVGAVAAVLSGTTPQYLDKIILRVTYGGSAVRPYISLDTFLDGSEVSDDDMIHLWMKLDRPDKIAEVRLYFICSSLVDTTKLPGTDQTYNTDAYIKTFRPSDFTAFFEATSTTIPESETAVETQQTLQQLTSITDPRTGAVKIINEQREASRSQSSQTASGRGQWTEFGVVGLPLKRGEFKRIGNNTDRGWSGITGLCVAVITNDDAVVNVWFDDIYVTGGYGLNSAAPGNQRYDYRVINYDPRVGVKSNPTDEQGPAYHLDAVRQGIIIHPNAYGDSNIRQWAYRRGGTLVSNWYKVGETETDGGTILDALSDTQLLNAEILETDNDQPVTTVDQDGEEVLAQEVPALFGPVQDLAFAVGDPHRPGTLYWCKSGQMDHWPAFNNVEVCAPSEELMNGLVYQGQAYVFSRERLFNIYINTVALQKVTVNPTACTKGLIGRWAFCLAGGAIYFVAYDGIYRTGGGAQENLSDKRLKSLFDGKTRHGYLPIDKQFPNDIRLWENDNDLWFKFRDTGGTQRIYIYNIVEDYWRVYDFSVQISCGYREETSNPRLLLGGFSTAKIYNHTGENDLGSAISSRLTTGALNQGLMRQNKQYGDGFLKAQLNDTLLTVGMAVDHGQTSIGSQVLQGDDTVQTYYIDPTSNTGPYGKTPRISTDIQLDLTWSSSANPPQIFHGGPSYIVLPDTIQQRVTDWSYEGRLTDKYVKGLFLDCDTGGITKQIQIQADGVTQTTIVAQTMFGRQSLHFSWPRFLGRNLRLQPIFGGINYLLEAYYRLEEQTGLARQDATGNGHTLSDPLSDMGQSTLVQGFCLQNTGTGSKLTRAYDADLDPGGDFAIQVWFSVASLAAAHQLFGMNRGQQPAPGPLGDCFLHYNLVVGTNGHVYFAIGTGVNDDDPTVWQEIEYTDTTIVVDTKYHIVAWVDTTANTVNLQINNGTILSVAKTVTMVPNSSQMELCAGLRLNGKLDEVGLWMGRILVEEEREWLYNEGTGQAYPLVNSNDPWILYSHRWIFDEEPAKLLRWETNELDHGIPSWQIPVFAYITLKSTATVTLTLTVYNQAGVGTDYIYNINSTVGVKIKEFVKFNASKGVFFKYTFTSTVAFYLYREESVVHIQPWPGGNLQQVQPFGSDDLDLVRGLHDAGLSGGRSGGGNG